MTINYGNEWVKHGKKWQTKYLSALNSLYATQDSMKECSVDDKEPLNLNDCEKKHTT